MSDIPVWVSWFHDLANKIDEVGETGLIERVKQVDWRKDDPAILRYGDESIDPFSFLYFLAHTFDTQRKEAVKESVSRVFGIENQDIFSGEGQSKFFPISRTVVLALFHDGKEFYSEFLWRLFRQAHQGIDTIDADDFAATLDIKNAGPAKLTQCFFFINPEDFMPIVQATFSRHKEFGLPSISKATIQMKEGTQGLDYYKSLLKKFQSAFPGRSFYEINAELIDERKNRTAMQKEQKKQKKVYKVYKEDKSMTHPLNQILYGPPGTGKTWNTVNHALAIIEDKDVKALEEEGRDSVKQRFDALKDEEQIEMVTFHQNFAYEDFIEGIRPVLDDDSDDSINVHYEIVDGVFKTIADRAKKNLEYSGPDKKYVLIIDEINRGNIAKIFGELITLIEQSKRIGESDATTATLPYSSNSMEGGFGVPNNLYIIGTMNTADRSIAPLDTALRRRFDFIEMMPEPEHPLISQNLDGVNCQQLLSMMNERITALIDREHQIGHSYFIDINSMAQLADAFKNRIIPLLEEYFYDDREKINLVLDNNKFMISKKIRIGLFYNTEFVNTEKMIYELIKPNNPEWEKPENYQAIYQSKLQAEETEAADAT